MLVIYIIEVYKDYTYTVKYIQIPLINFYFLQILEEETSCGHITIFENLYEIRH